MDGKNVSLKNAMGSLSLWMVAVVLFSFMGCTMHVTKDIGDRLDPDSLYRSFNVEPRDLSAGSKCSAPPTVKIVNAETRTEDFEALQNPPVSGFINPKEMVDRVCRYLKDGFERSRIKGDDQSNKVIQVKMEDLKATAGVWSFGSYFKLQLTIPETRLTKSYEAKDNTLVGYTAAAYAIHGVTRQIIDDPEIQAYILCR